MSLLDADERLHRPERGARPVVVRGRLSPLENASKAAGTDRITDVVVTEVIRIARSSGQSG